MENGEKGDEKRSRDSYTAAAVEHSVPPPPRSRTGLPSGGRGPRGAAASPRRPKERGREAEDAEERRRPMEEGRGEGARERRKGAPRQRGKRRRGIGTGGRLD